MNPYEMILRPVDTEKTRFLASEQGKYTFEVHPGANKIELKRAFEEVFDVDVVNVHVMIMPAKSTRLRGRRRSIRRSPWKKAIFTVAEGQRLDIFGGV